MRSMKKFAILLFSGTQMVRIARRRSYHRALAWVDMYNRVHEGTNRSAVAIIPTDTLLVLLAQQQATQRHILKEGDGSQNGHPSMPLPPEGR